MPSDNMTKIRFTKVPKLRWESYAAALLAIGGFFYLISGIQSYLHSNFPGWYSGISIPIWYAPLIVLAFALLLELKPVKGRIYQSAIARQERKYGSWSAHTDTRPKIVKTYKKVIDFKNYITEQTNHNVFIAGSSGTGKTTLMRYLIGLFPYSVKTIFSFKARDDYLRLGIPILKVSEHAGDPFADKEAFVQSFIVTYPMNTQGVAAASVPSMLRTTLQDCNTWGELNAKIGAAIRAEKPGSITHSVYTFVQQKLVDLELKTQPYRMDQEKSIILDFSGLNESAKTFYAEFYLRQAWHNIEKSEEHPMKHIVIVDEAHRLLESKATIFGDVSRLIRARGALWCGTQNYADLPDYISNQFGVHLIFSTRSESDMHALGAINYLLPYAMTELPAHHFTDAASRELHDAIPIFKANIGRFKDYEEVYLKPAATEAVKKEKPAKMPDYKEKVLDILGGEASWPSKMARELAADTGEDFDKTRLAVSKAIKSLQSDGAVARTMLNIKGKDVMLYYRKDPSMSGLHRFMERRETKKLDKQGIIYELAKPGEDRPDIMTKDFDIEIETGLKHDLGEFAKRMAKVEKKTYIIVPNPFEKERYQKVISSPLVTIFLLDEF